MDIANLTIKVDSNGVVTATGRLKELTQTGGKAEKATDRLKDSWQKSLATYAKVAAALIAVKKAMDFAIKAADLAAQVNQATAALENMAAQVGLSADEIVSSMQRMSGQTLSQLDVLQAANRAALLGLPLDQLDRLMQVARASATALGTDVSQMFDDIVTGIGRGSKMILDNLGIVFSAEEAYRKFAETQGKSVKELTEVERRQAFLNATLEEGERIMKLVGKAGQEMTDTEPVQMYRAALADLTAEIGQRLLPTINDLRLELAEGIREWTEALRLNRQVREAMGMEPSAGPSIEILQEQLINLGRQLEKLQKQRKEIEEYQKTQPGILTWTSGPALKQLDKDIAAIVQQMSALQQQIQRLQKAGVGAGGLPGIGDSAADAAGGIGELTEKLLDLDALFGDLSFYSLEQVTSYFLGLIETMRAAGAPIEAIDRAVREMIRHQEEFLSLQGGMQMPAIGLPSGTWQTDWAAAEEDAAQYFDQLQRTAEALEMRLGPAQAAYNEELRQLEILKPYLSMEAYNNALEKLKQEFIELQDPAYQFKNAMEDLGERLLYTAGYASLDVFRDIGEALHEGTLSAESFSEAMGRMVKQILDALPLMFLQAGLQLIIDKQWALGLGFIAAAGITGIASGYTSAYLASAQGNVFHGGNLVPFGVGGLITQPTVFPMANGGMGLAGEKSWEAIMPLRRMGSGNLGVEAVVSPVHVTINNYTSEPVRQRERRRPNGEREIEVIVGNIMRKQLTDGSLDKSMSANYGVRRQGQRL